MKIRFAIVQHFDDPDHRLYFLWTSEGELLGCSRDQWAEIVKHVAHEGCHGHRFNVCFPDPADRPDQAMMDRLREAIGIAAPVPCRRVPCPTCGAWMSVPDEPPDEEIPITWHPNVIKRTAS